MRAHGTLVVVGDARHAGGLRAEVAPDALRIYAAGAAQPGGAGGLGRRRSDRWGREGGWPATFGDARLDALIAEAILHNPDLLVAAARVEAAAQYVEVAESKLYPQVDFLARGGGEMSGDDSGLKAAGSSRTGNRTSGAACGRRGLPTSAATKQPSPTPNTRANRLRPWWRSPISSPSKRDCSSALPKTW